MDLNAAAARIRGYWAGRGKSTAMRVYPGAKVKVGRSASVEIADGLYLGTRWEGGRYYPSLATFGAHSRIVVSASFTIYSSFHLGVAEGAELRLGSGFFNTGSLVVCTNKIVIGD
jgi:hypothetical protein